MSIAKCLLIYAVVATIFALTQANGPAPVWIGGWQGRLGALRKRVSWVPTRRCALRRSAVTAFGLE